MAGGPVLSGSTLRTLSWVAIGLGIVLLLVMPVVLTYFAVSGTRNAHIPGTLVIITAAGGMALVVIGAALRA